MYKSLLFIIPLGLFVTLAAYSYGKYTTQRLEHHSARVTVPVVLTMPYNAKNRQLLIALGWGKP